MEAIVLNGDNFEAEVLHSDVPVLVDFWASWCGYCMMLSPVVDEVAKEAEGFKVGKVNTDENMDLAEKYNVSHLPCLLVFKGGEEVKRSVGFISKDEVLALVK